MKYMISAAKYFMLMGFFYALPAQTATDIQQNPYTLVQQTTVQVLDIVNEAKQYYATDPQHFQQKVTDVMDTVIDFNHFARGVMGTYASEQRYKSLTTETEKSAFTQRIKYFSATFKQGLVETYAKGLLNFNGEKIETLPAQKGDDLASGSVMVLQNIYNASGKPYRLAYSMRRNKQGEWKLQNIIIEGINLGLTYRNQFAAAADLYKGDIAQVIAHWRVEPDISSANKTDAAKR
jgi:phospholipid transport system substrate-binding protein